MKRGIKRRPRTEYSLQEVEDFILEEEYPTIGKFRDLSGNTYGRWTVLKYAGKDGGKQPKYFCQCSCESRTIYKIYGHHLRNGVSTSCGCEHKEVCSKTHSKSIYHYKDLLRSFKRNWELLGYIKTTNTINGFCPDCKQSFSITSTNITLKSGGCYCTMKSGNGFSYKDPAWFYIFKISGDDGSSYWKYGVTQKSCVELRDHGIKTGYQRELVFSEILATRYETIRLEALFKEYLINEGCIAQTESLMKNGYTECFSSEHVTLEDLLNLFWSSEPSYVPFRTDNLLDVEVLDYNTLKRGIKAVFNLNNAEAFTIGQQLRRKGLSYSNIDLTQEEDFLLCKNLVRQIKTGS